MTLQTVLLALLAIFVVVLVHESGHFFMAKACGVKVLRFSIGFGKALYSYRGKSGTEYVLALLPLGGYVKMLDDREHTVASNDFSKAFNRQSVWKRMLITVAGPVMNFILAMVIFWGILVHGVTHHKAVISEVTPHSIAADAGLQSGDVIVAIDHYPVSSQEQLLLPLIRHVGDQDQLLVTVKPRHKDTLQTHTLSLVTWKQNTLDENILSSLGITLYFPALPPLIAQVVSGTPAEKAGLLPDDEIVAINQHPITELPDVFEQLQGLAGQKTELTIRRGAATQKVTVELGVGEHARGFLGVRFQEPVWPEEMVSYPHYNFFTAWAPAAQQSMDLIVIHAIILKKLLNGELAMNKTLGGPVSIVRGASNAQQAGVEAYLAFMAFISIALGFLNILPFPVLDGGYLMLQVIEVVTRRTVPLRIQNILWIMGATLLLLLMAMATYYDVLRWLN